MQKGGNYCLTACHKYSQAFCVQFCNPLWKWCLFILPVLLSSCCPSFGKCKCSLIGKCKVERVCLVGLTAAWAAWASSCACAHHQKYRTCNFKHSPKKRVDQRKSGERKCILNSKHQFLLPALFQAYQTLLYLI